MSKARSRARRLAVQAVYEWQMSQSDANGIRKHHLASEEANKADKDYFTSLFNGVVKNIETLDAEITPMLNRPYEEVDMVEKAILRLSTFEFMHHPEVPYKVVINEAVELTKIFGGEQGHKFVNGILDKLAIKLRSSEIGAA
ncbi:MAG: transcription antitermination factor NusB [Gammaproteobacteria bacterium]|nr:transcription antitermination factor NusB [Gammaproteobacteria bacterium]